MTQITTHRGYIIKNRKGLKHWEALLEEWILCTERYCRVAAGEDAPFIYTERAHIGLLAGAAWRCGRIALEEFQYKKGRRNKKKWNGRVDLYLASESTEEMIEAKFAWLSLINPNRASSRINSVLDTALVDAKNTKGNDPGLTCLAAAFLPTWLKVKRESLLEINIIETIKEAQEANFHALAWCFPKEYRTIENGSGNYTPGVVLSVRNSRYA